MSDILKAISQSGKKQLLLMLLIFLLALSLRLVYIFLFEAEITPYDDPWFFLRTAQNLTDGGGYHEVNLLAYRPPLYSYFIAGVFSLFGRNVDAVRLVQALLAGVMCAAIFLIGSKFISLRVGTLASFFCAVYPLMIHYSVQVWAEQLFTYLIVLATLTFLLSLEKPSFLWRGLTGILLGLSSLTREAGLPVLFGFLLWFIITERNLWISLKRWWIIALLTLMVIAPWTIRNYRTFGAFVPISTNGGINFYMGNNPEATGTFRWVVPPGARWNEASPRGLYEIQASQLGYRYGWQFIREHPGKFVELIAKRFYYLLRPPVWTIDIGESLAETTLKLVWLVMYIPLFILALIIGPFFIRPFPKVLLLFFILLFMLALPYLVTFSATRFSVPLAPFMALIAAVVVDAKFFKNKQRLIL
jgi:4-amino-4-deoxy-L-arabinose transferase-like glycosyltransferase